MDAITALVHTLNSGWLGAISSFIDNDLIYAAMLLIAILLGERKPEKLVKIFFVLVLVFFVSYGIKGLFAVERPCVSLSLDYCPHDYSFPSLHAATAFAVMIPFLNKRSFWLYFLFAVFVSFTRLVLAVHGFRDIAAALVIALVVYHVVDSFWPKEKNNSPKSNGGEETRRQIFHIALAICAMAVLALFGKGVLIAANFFILIIGLLLVNRFYCGERNPLVNWFIRNFERPGVRFPGWGAACYATGTLLLAVFLNDSNLITASLIILGFGDAFSTLAGLRGKIRLPYNKDKTLEGLRFSFLHCLRGFLSVGLHCRQPPWQPW